MSSDIARAVDQLLSRHEQQAPGGMWDESAARLAFDDLATAGWLGVGIAEEHGGGGGTLGDALEVVQAVTGRGWPTPAADLVGISHPLLATFGMALPSDTSIGVVLTTAGRVDGTEVYAAAVIPWWSWADHLHIVVPQSTGASRLVSIDSWEVGTSWTALDGIPWASVSVRATPTAQSEDLEVPAETVLQELSLIGARVRLTQSANAMERALELTVKHVQERTQFGRPLSQFQAVQQHLAELTGEVTVAAAAAAHCREGTLPILHPIVVARITAARLRIQRAADNVVRIAHQLHGAMGTTREYELHRHTLSLLSWRDDFGAATYAEQLGQQAMDHGDVWAWLLDEPPTT